MTDEEIVSDNNQKFRYIFKKKFHDVVDSDDINDRNDDSSDHDKNDDDVFDARKFHDNAVKLDIDIDDDYNDSDDDVIDTRKFHGDIADPDIVVNDYDDSDDDVFEARKFHGNAVEPDRDIDVDDYDDDDEFSGITLHDVTKNYGRVCYHCHYTGKNRWAAHSICNLRYKIPKPPVVLHNGSN